MIETSNDERHNDMMDFSGPAERGGGETSMAITFPSRPYMTYVIYK